MTVQPTCSVIVPVRDGEATIIRCIESLLGLRYPQERLEILIVDNGSTDRTAELVGRQPVHLLREGRIGPYAARNRAAAAATGPILAFTDADCVAHPDWLAELAAGFEDPGVGCVAGEVASPPSATAVEEFARRRNLMAQANTLGHPFKPYAITANCAYRADVFRRLGGFCAEMQSGGDADLAWRMQLELGLRVAFRPQAIVWHHHRTTLRDLAAQSRRYAIGAVDLARRFDLPSPPVGRRLAGLGLAAARAAVAVPASWVRSRGRIGPDVIGPLCEVVWRGGEVAGLIHAMRHEGANHR